MTTAHLVFVAGASPQVITETVYALARQGVTEGELFVLTTERGRDIISRQLLQRGGAWARLRREHPSTRRFRLSAGHVEVLRDAAGTPLDDVRTRADNVAAANQIVRFTARHCREGSPPLHASIAGGRKTMGYLLAAAMMLYGRGEDQLSHVLVRPSELEGTDFYFPPRRLSGVRTYHRPDGTPVKVAASHIRVELAELPFLRLRALGDPAMLRTAPFSELMDRLQADLEALAAPQITLVTDRDVVRCGDREVRLSPVRFAIYALLAERRRNGCGQADCTECPRCFVSAAEFDGTFRDQLRARLQVRQSWGANTTWDATNFRAERSKINRTLRRELRGASAPFEIQAGGARGAGLYGLRLDPDAIRVGDHK